MTQTRAITLNALSLYAVALVLAAAYAAQFILQELPQVQDSINTAPVIPEPAAARPQPDTSGAGDPTTRAVGMAR